MAINGPHYPVFQYTVTMSMDAVFEVQPFSGGAAVDTITIPAGEYTGHIGTGSFLQALHDALDAVAEMSSTAGPSFVDGVYRIGTFTTGGTLATAGVRLSLVSGDETYFGISDPADFAGVAGVVMTCSAEPLGHWRPLIICTEHDSFSDRAEVYVSDAMSSSSAPAVRHWGEPVTLHTYESRHVHAANVDENRRADTHFADLAGVATTDTANILRSLWNAARDGSSITVHEDASNTVTGYIIDEGNLRDMSTALQDDGLAGALQRVTITIREVS